jgi:hypothetical protein
MIQFVSQSHSWITGQTAWSQWKHISSKAVIDWACYYSHVCYQETRRGSVSPIIRPVAIYSGTNLGLQWTLIFKFGYFAEVDTGGRLHNISQFAFWKYTEPGRCISALCYTIRHKAQFLTWEVSFACFHITTHLHGIESLVGPRASTHSGKRSNAPPPQAWTTVAQPVAKSLHGPSN